MNKKLLVIAVGAAMVAGSAAAMAEGTVYGKINVGVTSYDDGGSGTAASDGLGIFDEASRLGVKGSSDLGGGLKAVFKMEGTVDMEGSGSFDFNRDTYVGLKGGFGEVTMGRRNTAYKNATGKMDMFGDMMGDMTGNGFGHFDQRQANMLKYKNKFGAVSLEVDVQFPETNDDDTTTTVDEEALGNSIAVGFAPMKGLKMSLATATCGGTCEGAAEGDTATKLGVHWSGGPHAVNFVYKTEDDDSATVDEKQTVMYAQYAMTMGKNVLQLAYQTLDDDGTVMNATQTSVALVHKFNKSTKAYVAYSAVDNEDNATAKGRLTSGLTDLSPAAGDDPSTFGVGITNNF